MKSTILNLIALLALVLAATGTTACDKEAKPAGDASETSAQTTEDQAGAAPSEEDLVQPKFSIDERHELSARVEMKKVMKSEELGEKSQPSEPLEFDLTIEPKGEEVHFYWADPTVEALPRESEEEKAQYLRAKFERMWSPSFAVSKQGRFLRVLEEDQIRAGFDASMQGRIDAGADAERVKKMADSNDPIEVMTEVGKRRWAEMVGHMLINEFVLGQTVKARGVELTVTENINCDTGEEGGECFRFETKVPVSQREIAETLGGVTSKTTAIQAARREAVLVAKPDQMLPWRAQSVLHLEVELGASGAAKEKVTSRTIESIDLSPRVDEAPDSGEE